MIACQDCSADIPGARDRRRRFCDSCRLSRRRVTERAAAKAWSERHPENKAGRQRRFIIKRKYGLTEEALAALIDSQGGICAMGGCDKPAERIDHCHETGGVRGVLCHRCNILLAGVEDRDFLERALTYLAREEVNM